MSARTVTPAEARTLLNGTTPWPWRVYGNAASEDALSDTWTISHDGDDLAELHADNRPEHGSESDESVAALCEADADLMAAAPALAATVAAEPARIAAAVEAVTAERDRWRDALRDAARHTYVTTPADNDDPEGLAQNIADVLTTLQEPSEERDAALAHAAELESALRAAREVIEEAEAEKCDMLRDLERLRVQRDALRAIIEGRTTPPTPAEIAAHEATGGRWRCVVPGALNMSVDAMHGHAAQLHREILAAAGYERSLWWATDAAARPCAWPLAAEVTP